MTKVECFSRAKFTAVRVEGESDLDEWLCGVELAGNVSISKTPDGSVVIKARDLKLAFCYGDWIVADQEENYKVYSDEDFREEFESNRNARIS